MILKIHSFWCIVPWVKTNAYNHVTTTTIRWHSITPPKIPLFCCFVVNPFSIPTMASTHLLWLAVFLFPFPSLPLLSPPSPLPFPIFFLSFLLSLFLSFTFSRIWYERNHQTWEPELRWGKWCVHGTEYKEAPTLFLTLHLHSSEHRLGLILLYP